MKAHTPGVFLITGVACLLISAALLAAESGPLAFAQMQELALQKMDSYRKSAFLLGAPADKATVEVVNQAWELGRYTETDPLLLADLAVNHGSLTNDSAAVRSALDFASNLVKEYQKQNQASPALIRPLLTLGHLNYDFEGLLGALKYYKQAFTLADQYWAGDLRLADLYLEAGARLSSHSHLKSRDYLQEALDIYSSLSGTEAVLGMAKANMHLGRYWIRRVQYVKAERHLQAGLALLGNNPVPSATFLGLHTQLARVYDHMHKPELAQQHDNIISTVYAGEANDAVSPLYVAAPRYSRNARRLGITGHVTLSFTVNELGEVVNPEVVEHSGHNDFAAASMQAATQMRFAPRFENGSAVATDNIQFTYTFNIFD